jgi:rRNA maturation RNase YbeY
MNSMISLGISSFFPLSFSELPGLDLSIAIDNAVQATYVAWLPRLEEGVKTLWPIFCVLADREGIFDIIGLNYPWHKASLELAWTGNAAMRRLNHEYRGKDKATDVLSFTLLADSLDRAMWLSLPQVQLGSLFISLDWAVHSVNDLPQQANNEVSGARSILSGSLPQASQSLDTLTEPLFRYIMERVLHGWLHLHGHHHDTMPDFERVVRIQQYCLNAAFGVLEPISIEAALPSIEL